VLSMKELHLALLANTSAAGVLERTRHLHLPARRWQSSQWANVGWEREEG